MINGAPAARYYALCRLSWAGRVAVWNAERSSGRNITVNRAAAN